MCNLCDRAWMGMYNHKWGDKYMLHNPRNMGRWTTRYNQYHDPYMKRFKRNIGFDSSMLKRYNEPKYW